jgi:serine protease Do
MLRKLSAFILLTTLNCCVVIYGQQKTPTAPQSPKPPEKVAQALVYSDMFHGGGSYLGVQTQEVTRENFSKYGLNEVRGVAVEKVLENSPAAQAGLQDGDVIVRFEGEEITSTRKLNRLISEVAPDHKAKVVIARGGSEREFTVTMGKRPTPKFFENGTFEMPAMPPLGEFKMQIPPRGEWKVPIAPRGNFERLKNFPPMKPGEPGVFVFSGSDRQIGVSVTSVTKQLGEYFGIGSEGKGLLINNVRADSPAAKAGLKAGDVIVEVEGKEVKGMGDFVRIVNEKKEGDVTLTIIRDRNRQTVRVTPEQTKEGNHFFEFDNDGDETGSFKTIAPKTPMTPQPAFEKFNFDFGTRVIL